VVKKMIDLKAELLALANTKAKELQKEAGREERGIMSTQVIAVIYVLADILAIDGKAAAVAEVPK
jgi:hypothetical protein